MIPEAIASFNLHTRAYQSNTVFEIKKLLDGAYGPDCHKKASKRNMSITQHGHLPTLAPVNIQVQIFHLNNINITKYSRA
jgi:hypothetical protein